MELRSLVLLACLAFAAGKIVKFDTSNPSSNYYHSHTETLFKAPNERSSVPYISLDVLCPKPDDVDDDMYTTSVSVIVIKTVLNGIGRVSDDDGMISARCAQKMNCPLTPDFKPRQAEQRRDDATPTTTTTSTMGPSTSIPSQPSPPGQPTNSNEQAQTIDFDEHQVEGYSCDNVSGLMYVPDWVTSYFGFCMFCPSEEDHSFKVPSEFFDHNGYYTIWVESMSYDQPIQGRTTFHNLDGYLEAALVPEKTFYGVLGLFYLFLGIFWAVLLGMYYKDLLRVQFWIGGVVFLGMLEMAISYGDLDYLNRHGFRSRGLMIFSKLLFAAKNTLARLLVLVVSMGYGIVKPRIGDSYKQVVAIGLSYYFFAAAYGVTHALGKTESQENKTQMMMIVPLSILDAAICWWIFMSLAHTMKILSLRNNEAKLALYSQFQWALVVSVVASVIFGIWYLTDHARVNKQQEPDWENQWWADAFWHLLFFSILVVIMFLWRPTQNNQRYAYSALENGDDDEEEEFDIIPTFQQDAMKMRNLQSRNHPSRPDFDEEDDEDLRWVEENIPSVVTNADSGFGNLPMDSDEELMHTRFEMSKME